MRNAAPRNETAANSLTLYVELPRTQKIMMRRAAFALAAMTPAACDDTRVGGVAGSGRDDFSLDVAACTQAMAFRESTTPTLIDVVSAAPLPMIGTGRRR